MSWVKIEPFRSGKFIGCLHAGPVEDIAPMNMLIGVGFGIANVTCDGAIVWDEMSVEDDADYWTTADAESMAEKDPDHDWRIVMNAPLRNMTYQRHDSSKWVLIESGMGFA